MKLLIAGTGSSIVAKKLQNTAAIIAAAEPEGHAVAIQNALHRQIASTAANDDSSARPVSLCSTRLPNDAVRRSGAAARPRPSSIVAAQRLAVAPAAHQFLQAHGQADAQRARPRRAGMPASVPSSRSEAEQRAPSRRRGRRAARRRRRAATARSAPAAAATSGASAPSASTSACRRSSTADSAGVSAARASCIAPMAPAVQRRWLVSNGHVGGQQAQLRDVAGQALAIGGQRRGVVLRPAQHVGEPLARVAQAAIEQAQQRRRPCPPAARGCGRASRTGCPGRSPRRARRRCRTGSAASPPTGSRSAPPCSRPA